MKDWLRLTGTENAVDYLHKISFIKLDPDCHYFSYTSSLAVMLRSQARLHHGSTGSKQRLATSSNCQLSNLGRKMGSHGLP